MAIIKFTEPGQALRKQHKQTKFTRKKKIEVLNFLASNWNYSACAAKLNIHRNSLMYAINHDQQFKQAVDDVKNAYLDNIENAGLTVAVQPTREGFNDRKLMLQAHRRDTYNPQPTLQVNHTITDSNATIEARKILQGLAINTDYKVIE